MRIVEIDPIFGTLSDEAKLIAAVLEIPAPQTASAGELLQWVEWWKPSYEAAQGFSDEHKAYGSVAKIGKQAFLSFWNPALQPFLKVVF